MKIFSQNGIALGDLMSFRWLWSLILNLTGYWILCISQAKFKKDLLKLKSLVTIRINEIFRASLVTVKSLLFLFVNCDKDKHKLCERKQ